MAKHKTAYVWSRKGDDGAEIVVCKLDKKRYEVEVSDRREAELVRDFIVDLLGGVGVEVYDQEN